MDDSRRRGLVREAQERVKSLRARAADYRRREISPAGDMVEREAAWIEQLARELEAALEEKERACRERFALDEAIRRTRMAYPENVFPPNGESVDAKSAAWARMVCDNIRSTAQDILEELEEQP